MCVAKLRDEVAREEAQRSRGGGGKLSARVHRPPMPAHAVSAWHSAQGESA